MKNKPIPLRSSIHIEESEKAELQLPRGFSESDEEDELYEEVEDTRKQHSQFTIWYLPINVLLPAEFKV